MPAKVITGLNNSLTKLHPFASDFSLEFLLVGTFYGDFTFLSGLALLECKITVESTSLSNLSSSSLYYLLCTWDFVGHTALLSPTYPTSNIPSWSGFTFSNSMLLGKSVFLSIQCMYKPHKHVCTEIKNYFSIITCL